MFVQLKVVLVCDIYSAITNPTSFFMLVCVNFLKVKLVIKSVKYEHVANFMGEKVLFLPWFSLTYFFILTFKNSTELQATSKFI